MYAHKNHIHYTHTNTHTHKTTWEKREGGIQCLTANQFRLYCHKVFFLLKLYCQSHMSPESTALRRNEEALKWTTKASMREHQSHFYDCLSVRVSLTDPQCADLACGLWNRVHLQREPGDCGTQGQEVFTQRHMDRHGAAQQMSWVLLGLILILF